MPVRKPGRETGQPLRTAQNIRLALAFDGAGYHGWQIQKGKPTIQGSLCAAIERIGGERVVPIGSGRTDSGTHARELVANFITNSPITPAQWMKALNGILPRDIRVLSARKAPLDFHSRRSASSKVYRYQVYRGPVMPPHLARDHYHFPYRLDLQKMRSAARLFVGELDFAGFCSASVFRERNDPSAPVNTIRRILRCELAPRGRRLLITVEGNGFLRHMVRNMTGALLEVGRGQRTLDQIRELFGKRDRTTAGFTVPAHGLILLKVRYKT